MKRGLVALLVLLPLPAFAADSTHAACTGVASIDAGGGLKKLRKLVVLYDEQRAGADQRTTTIRTSYNGRTYDGTTTTKAAPSIAIKLARDRTDVLFDGTAEYLEGGGLELAGTYLLDGRKTKLVAVLECTEV